MTGSIPNVETCEKACDTGSAEGWAPRRFSADNFQQAHATAFEFFRFPFADADPFKDRTLNHNDVPDVICLILEVQTKSRTFGRVLRLPKVTVDSIHQQYSDPQECLFGVLDEFVKQVEPPPTWRVILEALRNPLIRYFRLAQEIEIEHCLQQDGVYL